MIDAADVQLLHLKNGWVKGLYSVLEFSGKDDLQRFRI